MKKQILTAATAVLLCLALTVPAFAAKARIRQVEISFDAISITANHTRTLFAMVTLLNPKDTFDHNKEIDKGVIWESSNPEIVDVVPEDLNSAIITGISPGTAVITATAEDGKTDTCTVTVTDTILRDPKTETARIFGALAVENEDISGAQFNYGELVNAQNIKPLVEEAMKKASKETPGSVVLTDKSSVTAEALSAAAYTATYEGGSVRLKFTTTLPDNGIQGQLTVDPALAKSLTQDLRTAVYTSSEKTAAVHNHFTSFYTNPIEVIACGQQGDYGMNVGIAAKVNLSALNTGSLLFYAYNASDNSYTLLENMNYQVDGDYLHFTTQTGGYILVTDRPLTLK